MFPILLEKIIILAVSVNQAASQGSRNQPENQPVHQTRQPDSQTARE
ncbi:MAG: hypothetical protein V7K64_33595 [Nostoc sp.]|nr:hypothetical protein [Nostoc sp. JL34]MBN3883321.1 hypothetical protein [Nostoc sp. JL34]